MKKLILIIAIIFSGMLTQAQTMQQMRDAFEYGYEQNANTDWRVEFDMSFDRSTIVIDVKYNMEPDNIYVAKRLYDVYVDNYTERMKREIREIINVSYVEFNIKYKDNPTKDTYKGKF